MPQVSASPEVSKLAIADAMAGTPPALSAHRARLVHPRPGLRLHAEDAFDPVDARAQGTCVPGLHLVVLLEGQLDLTYGRQRVALSTRCEAAPVAPKKQKCGGKARYIHNYAHDNDTSGAPSRAVMPGGGASTRRRNGLSRSCRRTTGLYRGGCAVCSTRILR